MIIILIAVLLATGFGIALPRSDMGWEKIRVKMTLWCIFWFNFVCAVIFSVIIFHSYSSYLDQRSFYDATIEQYATAITMYADYAEIDVESAAWTDLKYQGYQDNISKLIISLRNRTIEYNEAFVKKNKMHNNPFFSWLVIGMDEDMKLIKMKITK